jgi:hypothetical protein
MFSNRNLMATVALVGSIHATTAFRADLGPQKNFPAHSPLK